MKIKSRNHILEIVSRHPDKLEKGLRFLDSNIHTIKDDLVDVLAIDHEDRLVIIWVRETPQTARSNKGVHIIKESIALWDWVIDLKDDYIDAANHLLGKKPARIPPRLFLVAPSFDKSICSQAKHISKRIEIELFTYDPEDFKLDKAPFKKIDLENFQKPTAQQITQLNKYTEAQVKALREVFDKAFKEDKSLGYHAFKPEDHFGDKSAAKKDVQRFIKDAEKLSLRPQTTKNQIIFTDEIGEEVAKINYAGDKSDIEIVKDSSAVKRFPISELKKAISEIS